jgi:hypothetical protein
MLKFRVQAILVVSFVLLFGGVRRASAQSGDVFFGMGTATDSSNGQQINTFGDGTLYNTPKMTGLFGTFGADYMFRPHLGVGADATFRFGQGDYAGLNYRPTFYDFDAVYQPTSSSSRIVPDFKAGLGVAKLSFYYSQQFCDVFAGCSTSNQFIESSNHFQLHVGGGVKFYVKGDMYIRPAVDVHWVDNFYQFGSNWVPQYTVSVGYTFGRH